MVPFRPFWAYLGLFGPKRYQTYPAFMAPTTWHPLRCIALVVGTKTKGGILGLILRLHTYGLHALGCLPLFLGYHLKLGWHHIGHWGAMLFGAPCCGYQNWAYPYPSCVVPKLCGNLKTWVGTRVVGTPCCWCHKSGRGPSLLLVTVDVYGTGTRVAGWVPGWLIP
jgi:hypothetical protein